MPRISAALLPLLVASLLGLSLAPPAAAQAPARTVQDSVSLAPDGDVSIDNHEGSITVTTWARDVVRYEARIMPTDEDPRAEKTSIRVRASNSTVRLSTEHEDGDDESTVFGFTEDGFQWGGINIPAVHYTITMPETAALRIDDHESTIEVTGLRAPLRIDTHEGPITIADQRGETQIDTHEGDVSIRGHQGDVKIDSHESRMDLRRVTGALTVDTHEGSLTVDELDGGLRLESHEGDASVSFAALTSDVVVDTHEGDVTLSLPANAGFDLNTDLNDDATFASDFDLRSLRIADEEEDQVNYRGDVNGGGPEIYLGSHDGTFSLRRR